MGQNGIFFSSGTGCHKKLITAWRHERAVKYMTATRALIRGILKILNLSEILPVYLVDRQLYLSVAVAGNKYCTFGLVWGP